MKICLFYYTITLVGALPVSYTHLDVYKRQSKTGMMSLEFSFNKAAFSLLPRLRSSD